MTPLLHWISLSESPAFWAETVLSQSPAESRLAHDAEIMAAGYDLAAMADSLRQIYHGEG